MFTSMNCRDPKIKELRSFIAAGTLLLVLATCSCGISHTTDRCWVLEHDNGTVDLYSLSLRFAPFLHLHSKEPYRIVLVIPVFHPRKPLIAYHIIFDGEALRVGEGKSFDNEIVWVHYDPITLKITDVSTYWHRTVLRSDSCVIDARNSDQRPKIDVQWGQHGMLPLGWKHLAAIRPLLELRLYYNLACHLDMIQQAEKDKFPASFKGSYDDYTRFTIRVDVGDYISESDITVAENSQAFLESRLGSSFSVKKDWPDW